MDFLPAVRRWTSNDDLRRNTSCLHQCFDNRRCRIVTTIENEDNFVSVVILREQRAKVFFEPGSSPLPGTITEAKAENQEADGFFHAARKPRNETH